MVEPSPAEGAYHITYPTSLAGTMQLQVTLASQPNVVVGSAASTPAAAVHRRLSQVKKPVLHQSSPSLG